MKTLLIIDLDGTILHSLPASHSSFKKVFPTEWTERDTKIILNIESKWHMIKYLRKKGLSTKQIIKSFLELRKHAADDFFKYSHLYPDVLDLLKKLKKRDDLVIALVTRNRLLSDELYREKVIAKLNLEDVFDEMLAIFDKRKAIKKLLKKYNAEKGILIGDIQNDMMVAKEFGFIKIFVSWGYSLDRVVPCDYRVDTVQELDAVLSLILDGESTREKVANKTIKRT